MTPDGEWTERSNGIYNAVSDIMLYHAAQNLNRPELLNAVRANLRMMAYLVHPDGEVVTDYSGRQDYGQRSTLADYYSVCRLMAWHDQEPFFAAIAERAEEVMIHPGALPNNALLNILLHPELLENPVPPGELPTEYRKVLNGSFNRSLYLARMSEAGHQGRIQHSSLHPEFGAPVARHRSGRTSVSIMTETASFFALRHGSAKLLGVQIGSVFEPGVTKMSTMEVLPDGYVLSSREEKGYYGPVVRSEQSPVCSPGDGGLDVSPWYLLPHHQREVTHLQTHDTQIEVTEEGTDCWSLRIRSASPEDVLTQVVFVFAAEGSLNVEGQEAGLGKILWTKGTAKYTSGDDWLELEGAACMHTAAAIRNMPDPVGCLLLAVNLITPFDYRIVIRLSPTKDNGSGEE